MQGWVLERECAAAAGAFHSPKDASALRQSRDAKSLQWQSRERNGLCDDAGASIRVGFKVNRYHRCVTSAWNSGSARNEEVKHEKNVAEERECLNGDATKASASTKEGSISGIVLLALCIRQ